VWIRSRPISGQSKEPALQDARACAGVANEGNKMRELRREMSVYYDKPIPEDLERRVRKHIDTVARLKAECDEQRGRTAQASENNSR
jgi:hypothetical protein